MDVQLIRVSLQAPALRAAIHNLDPLLAIDQVQTVEHAEYESLASPRMMTLLMGIFAALALLISGSVSVGGKRKLADGRLVGCA